MAGAATIAAAAAIAAAGAGCGPSLAEQARREAEGFRCRDRTASYTAVRHLAGDELGVQMDCAQAGPRIVRWKMDRQGTRVEDKKSISTAEFDRVWRNIAGTGWENLKDCTTGSLGKNDPIYTFDIKDDQNQATFQCQSITMPFPYNGIVDPLDMAAQKGRGQLGDEEPKDLKELEQKEKEKGKP